MTEDDKRVTYSCRPRLTRLIRSRGGQIAAPEYAPEPPPKYEAQYVGDFTDKINMLSQFTEDPSTVPEDSDPMEVILAVYECESYEGRAFVLFERGGKLFEVNSSHCSCNGLDWSEEDTTLAALKHRATEGTLGKDYSGNSTFFPELTRALDYLEQRGFE